MAGTRLYRPSTAAEAKGGVTTTLGKQAQIVQRSSHDSLNSPLPLSMFSVHFSTRTLESSSFHRLMPHLTGVEVEDRWPYLYRIFVWSISLPRFVIHHSRRVIDHWYQTVVVSCPVVSTPSISRRYNWSRIFPQVPLSDAKRNRRPTWADHRSWLYAMVSRIPRGGRKTNAKKMFHGHIGWVNDSWSQPAMDEFAGAVKWSPLHASLTEDWLDMYIRTPMFNN